MMAEDTERKTKINMELKSSTLYAIQQLPGKTGHEKLQFVEYVIKQALKNAKETDEFDEKIVSQNIPQLLFPFVHVQMGKVLKQSNMVSAALNSEDVTIIKRALQANWLFDGSNKSVTNFNFFSSQILPNISLNTRQAIIKRLARHLGHKKEYILAQEFFIGFCNMYSLNECILQLLMACSENYIDEFLSKGKIDLPTRMVEKLFKKYPKLVIKLLKDSTTRAIYSFDCETLLPQLLRYHAHDFIEIVGSSDLGNRLKLGNKSIEMFFKNVGVEELIKKPRKYLPSLKLKLVIRKLSKEQFEIMLHQLLPETMKSFSFNEMLKYLEFHPHDQKLSLISKVFKDAYGRNLLDCLDKITPELIMMLSDVDRGFLAQKLLTIDSDWHLYNCKLSWRCYLPVLDAVKVIKEEISKTNSAENRSKLAQQMIYTCKVNNSKEALLTVLQYLSTRHRNDLIFLKMEIFESILNYFDLLKLNNTHWAVLKEMIQSCYVKNEFSSKRDMIMVLEKAVHYNILQNIPIDESMTLLLELKINYGDESFNILRGYPLYERQCLETFIELMQRKFLADNQIWMSKGQKSSSVIGCLTSIYRYNESCINIKIENPTLTSKEQPLSITHYPWLMQEAKTVVKEGLDHEINQIKSLLREHERELYMSWFTPDKEPAPEEPISKVHEQEGLNTLKNDHDKILKHWEKYFKSCQDFINYGYTKRFLKASRWYADIPVKFVEESLKQLSESNSCSTSNIEILAILIEGMEFAQVFEPMMPVSSKIDVAGNQAKDMYASVFRICHGLKLANPPLPLEFMDRLYQGDYLSTALITLMSVARQVSETKAIEFAKGLVKKPVSVKKHGIRLVCFVASNSDTDEFLEILWEKEKHESIRKVIFEKTCCLFKREPSSHWRLVSTCLKGLNVEEIKLFRALIEIIPNDYISDCMPEVFKKIDDLANNGLEPAKVAELTICSLKRVNAETNAFLSDEFCKSLLIKYTLIFHLNEDLRKAGSVYAVETYLMVEKEKLESRLPFFIEMLCKAIREFWNKPHPKKFRFYPMNVLFHSIVSDIVSKVKFGRIDQSVVRSVMDLFASILKPTQDPQSYMMLFFAIEFRDIKTPREFGLKVGKKIPMLINIFTAEMVLNIADAFSEFLQYCFYPDTEKCKLQIIEALMEAGTGVHSFIVAARMLFENSSRNFDDLYKKILQTLQTVEHPAVVSLLNEHVVSIAFSDYT